MAIFLVNSNFFSRPYIIIYDQKFVNLFWFNQVNSVFYSLILLRESNTTRKKVMAQLFCAVIWIISIRQISGLNSHIRRRRIIYYI